MSGDGLPLSFLDLVRSKDRQLVATVKSDAARLSSLGVGPGFVDLDAIPTSYPMLANSRLDEIIADYSKRHGISREFTRDILRQHQKALIASELRDLARRYQVLLSFTLGGHRIFRIAPGLASRLLNTQVDVPSAALRAPFESILLLFDDQATIGAFNLGRPFRSASAKGTVSAFVTEVDSPKGRRFTATSFHTRGLHRYGTYSRSFDCERGTVEEMLECNWDQPADRSCAPEYGRDFHRLLLNCLLYMGSRAARVRTAAETSARTRGVAWSASHVVVGDGLSPLSNSASGPARAGTRGSATNLLRRQLVIGHWRQHAVGAGRAERKLIWIEPYWRGPELGDAVNRVRLVR
ncbi:MAG: hypothetical protein QHC67_12810 [Sphingobium sp.]|uniref:hypothetical protein n=1 Tax=Sphingobium sp. TaxID=1912891 RepID=UPI0029B63E4C|nr:hypothetical protein [Sphingobium sp.]MDX3910683.1 hypothetical protein [Sphingobium sp.]